jgi:hypothetical protein
MWLFSGLRIQKRNDMDRGFFMLRERMLLLTGVERCLQPDSWKFHCLEYPAPFALESTRRTKRKE